MKIEWPSFVFPPVNLLNYPKQYRDYMNYAEERKRSNALKLKPTKRPPKSSRITVEPANGIGSSLQREQIAINLARRNGTRI